MLMSMATLTGGICLVSLSVSKPQRIETSGQELLLQQPHYHHHHDDDDDANNTRTTTTTTTMDAQMLWHSNPTFCAAQMVAT